MKTLKTIQTLAKIGKILSCIAFIFACIGFGGSVVGALSAAFGGGAALPPRRGTDAGTAGMSAPQTLRPGRYRHFKGREYELLFVATHSETLEPMVVYRALYGERGLWVRPAAMWDEQIERDGQVVRRFTYIGD